MYCVCLCVYVFTNLPPPFLLIACACTLHPDCNTLRSIPTHTNICSHCRRCAQMQHNATRRTQDKRCTHKTLLSAPNDDGAHYWKRAFAHFKTYTQILHTHTQSQMQHIYTTRPIYAHITHTFTHGFAHASCSCRRIFIGRRLRLNCTSTCARARARTIVRRNSACHWGHCSVCVCVCLCVFADRDHVCERARCADVDMSTTKQRGTENTHVPIR